METPCINACLIDPRHGLCSGCGRTIDEIAQWSTMTGAARRVVMRRLGERLRAIGRDTNLAAPVFPNPELMPTFKARS